MLCLADLRLFRMYLSSARQFPLRPSDVFIVTYPKARSSLSFFFLLEDISVLPCPIVQAGTTWAQRIVHLLRCGADINKDSRNVWEALPWLEAVWTVMLLCALLCPDSLVAGSCGHGSGSRGFPASVQEVWMV